MIVLQLFVALSPLWLSAIGTTILMARGASLWRSVLHAWALLVLFSFLIPLLIFPIGAIWGRTVEQTAESWLPTLMAVIPLLFLGWLYAFPVAGLAYLILKAKDYLIRPGHKPPLRLH